jgi:amino acid adenylation domain-containing protein
VTAPTVAAPTPGTTSRYPLSPLQQGMLLETLLLPGAGMYVNQSVLTFERLDAAAMLQAWQALADRHEVLRTSFHVTAEQDPYQLVHDGVTLDLPRHDWRELPAREREGRLRGFLAEDRHRGFELDRPPLLRLAAFRVAPERDLVVLSHHHLLLDGWSAPILQRELHLLYEGARRGTTPRLPPAKPYRDYIAWLEEQDVQAAQDHWRAYLTGFTSPTSLPGARPAGTSRSAGPPEVEEWVVPVPPDLPGALRALARRCRVSTLTALQVAWARVLSRHSGSDDVTFGLIVSGRPPQLEGVESMVGMFINVVPMRVRLDASASVGSTMRAVQAQRLVAQQFDFAPLAKIQGWCEVARGTPVFDSVLVSEATPGDSGPGAPGRRGERPPAAAMRQNVPLLLKVHEQESGLQLAFDFDRRRVSGPMVPRLGEQLCAVLARMADDPELAVGELDLMSPAERHRVTREWSSGDRVPIPGVCLHEVVEAQARRTPDAPAAMVRGTALSYRALNQQANRLAHHLRDQGIGPGDVVGLCLRRSGDLLVALLGILKSGAAYLPLDPGYPAERLSFMLADSGARVLVTSTDLLGSVGAAPGVSVFRVDADARSWARRSTRNPVRLAGPEDLAYVIYTSGSTGTPKGVAVPHRVPVNRLGVEHEAVGPGDVLCAKTSLSFVDSIWELFSAWRAGVCVHLVAEEVVQDPRLLVQALAEAGATRIVLVPSLLRALLGSDEDLAARLPRLRQWVVSGEPLPADLCGRFAERLPDAVLTNLYGISEVWDATRSDSSLFPGGAPIPIGRPLANTHVRVLDASLSPVPVGVSGELFVAGPGLARGYLHHPALTAERFLPDPFAAEPGERMYRTGDLARWLPDGNLDYLGRADAQLKVRGFRVEPTEVESALCEEPSVAAAGVVHRDGQLVACLVPAGDAVDLGALAGRLRTRLPAHLVPDRYLGADELPLTPSGKVDRRRLAGTLDGLAPLDLGVDRVRRPLSTPLEHQLAALWSELLGVTDLDGGSDFFALGGHSLLAMRLVSQLDRATGRRLPVSVVFEARTLAGLAERIEEELRTPEENATAAPIEPVRHERLVPVSHGQRRLWFLDQLNPGTASYGVPTTLSYRGERLDVALLRQALGEVVARHAALRTTFQAVDGEPYQVVHDESAVEVPVLDLTGEPPDRRAVAVRDERRRRARRPWDLANGPLLRAELYRLDADDYTLVVTVHHIATDGRSLGILRQELAAVHRALRSGRPPALPPLPVQYADYAVWQRQQLSGPRLSALQDFWARELEGVAGLALPWDRAEAGQQRHQGSSTSARVPPSTAGRLRDLVAGVGGTAFMGLTAGLQLLLWRHTGQTTFCVGTPVANRGHRDVEGLIGLFANTIALRADIDDGQTFRELLGQVRSRCVRAYAHEELPFDLVVDAVRPQRAAHRHPLFQVMVVQQQRAVSEGEQQVDPGVDTSNFDLLLLVREDGEGYALDLHYDTDLVDGATAETMVRQLGHLLDVATASPDERLSRLDLLAEDDRRHLLDVGLGASLEVDATLLHARLARRAAATPDRPALVDGDRTLTYRELDRLGDRLAAALAARGVGPETVVGVCLPRSAEMVVALVGVAKAGACFLPLDPGAPAPRRTRMVATAGCTLVLTGGDAEPATSMSDGPAWRGIGPLLAEEHGSRAPLRPPHPDHAAYVVFTSGSTGTPKGVVVTYGNLRDVVSAQVHELGLTAEDRGLQMLAEGFDAALGEVFRLLDAGGTLLLHPKERLLPSDDLVELMRRDEVTVVAMSPRALELLPAPADLPSLRLLIVGGEPCPREVVARWDPVAVMVNGYGPTETTIGATMCRGWPRDRRPPLGRPLPNARTYVVDRELRLVEPGVPGELCIGGCGVSRGYVGDPRTTAERFVPDPFTSGAGERMYRTGDLVRWTGAGTLDFLGRMDHQAKIRGYRVEPAEVAAVLQTHDRVERCAVVVTEGQAPTLAGYAVPTGERPTVSELRNHLKARLPDHMVPSTIQLVEALPLTSTGKLDRAALPAPDRDALVETPHRPPGSPGEAVLAAIWSQVLGVERVGVEDNFFELGGDSITSIRIVARAVAAGIDISAQDVFSAQTVAALAAAGDAPDRARSVRR